MKLSRKKDITMIALPTANPLQPSRYSVIVDSMSAIMEWIKHIVEINVATSIDRWLIKHTKRLAVYCDTDSIYIRKPRTIAERIYAWRIFRRIERFNRENSSLRITYTEIGS